MKKNRIFYFDALKILACFAVIMIHVTAEIYYKYDIDLRWSINYAYNSLSAWAVPIFCMVTGALLLPKEQTIKTVYTRYVFHIAVLLLFWGMYYWLVPSRNFTLSAAWESFKLVITGQAYSHLWYLYMLLGLYILTPVLSVFVHNASKRQVEYFLAVLFILSVLIPTLARYFPPLNKGLMALKINLSGEYLFYFIAGYYFHKYPWKRSAKIALCLIGILGLAVFSIGYCGVYTWLSSEEKSLPRVIAALGALGIFVLFQSMESIFQKRYFNKVIRILAPLTFGIYLIHFRVEKILLEAGLESNFINPIIGVPLLTLCIFTITGAITWVLTKIPLVKRLVQ